MKRDPLQNPSFTEPGIIESLREAFLGHRRPLDCVQVEISSACAARCAYCPRGARGGRRARHMEASTFAALWPLLRRSGRAHLQGWGEPFLHPRFFDFAALARKAGCLVSSTSCGLHMDEETARGIVRSGMDVLAFSLAGTDARSNAVREGAPFEQVCAGIALVQRVRKEAAAVHLELRCAYLLLADRMEAASALPDLAAELGLHAVVVSTLEYTAVPGREALAFAPHETEKLESARAVLERAATRARKLGVDFHYALPGPRAGRTCREGVERSLYVDAEGALSPCVYTNPPTREDDPLRRVFGTAEETDAFVCFRGERFAAFRAALASGAPEAPCVNCVKRFIPSCDQ
jgi:MoaA/NifB/PqqE/SkfB family radical SAM enzyme